MKNIPLPKKEMLIWLLLVEDIFIPNAIILKLKLIDNSP